MSILEQLARDLVAGAARSAGTAAASVAASDPAVQEALAAAKAKAQQLEVVLWVGGFMAVTTYLFVVVPNMEAPIPKALRRAR